MATDSSAFVRIEVTYCCGHAITISTKPFYVELAIAERQSSVCPDCEPVRFVTRFKVGSWGGRR